MESLKKCVNCTKEPMNCTLFEKKVSADVIKVKISR